MPRRRVCLVVNTAQEQFPVAPQVKGTKSSGCPSPLRSKANARSPYLGGPSSFRCKAICTRVFNREFGCHDVCAQFHENLIIGCRWSDCQRRYWADATELDPTIKARAPNITIRNRESNITIAFSCGARSAFTLKEQGYLRNMLSRRQLQGFVGARSSNSRISTRGQHGSYGVCHCADRGQEERN